MTRHFFWIAAATVLVSSLLSYEDRALAQQEEAAAEAEADTSDASADASADTDAAADASAADTSTEAEAQTDTQAGSEDSSATADAQSDTQAEAQTEPQQPASDPQAAPPTSDDSGRQPADQQAQPRQPQGDIAIPPPSDRADPGARQPREQSRLRQPQDQRGRDMATRDRGGRSDRSQVDVDIRRGIEFGGATDRGLVVNNVERNSFFFNSGIRRGDIIMSVHGRPVRSHDDFMRFIILQPGQRVPVVVLRDGRRETIFVQYRDIARRYPVQDERQYQAGGAYLGVVFDAQYPDTAVVLRTNPGSPAQEAGLQAGDILVALNGKEIANYQDAISMVRSMQPGDRLEIIFERARTEREALAMLDAKPGVRTATRPSDVRVEQQYVPADQPDDVRIDVNRRDDYDRSRDGRYEEGRPRLLPRLRN